MSIFSPVPSLQEIRIHRSVALKPGFGKENTGAILLKINKRNLGPNPSLAQESIFLFNYLAILR